MAYDGPHDEKDDGDKRYIVATVRLRRSGAYIVKTSAEATDGLRHRFSRGWEITFEDSSIYVGEIAWIPNFEGWPDDAPSWVASGDLVDIVKA